MKTIYLAGGCFWGLQKYLDQFEGIKETEVGYANGPDTAPGYKDVCAGSGHAETVRVVFDEVNLGLQKLLEYYFEVIDPTSVNRQGGDSGVQYRTGIFYAEEEQRPVVADVCKCVSERLGAKLAVIVEPIRNFFPAEEYHQKYLDKNPSGYCHIPASYFSVRK